MRITECGIKSRVFSTPFGWAGVAASAHGICRIVLPRNSRKDAERELAACGSTSGDRGVTSSGDILRKAVKLLQLYFMGRPVRFDLPLDWRGYTFFQKRVWRAVAGIPYGQTRSYAWVAARAKSPRAFRAVGQANGANPVPIIIP